MTERRILFLHLKKTGGTTFYQVIARHVPRKRRVQLNGDREAELVPKLARFSDSHRRQIELVQGHFFYGVHELFPGPSTYITMLREPVDRVISSYYFLRRTRASGALYAWLRDSGASLEEHASKLVEAGRNNLQTLALAGPPRAGEPEDMLERAKLHLERDFAVVGLTERFDETMLLCRRAFGWWNVLYAKARVNEGRPRVTAVPEATRAAIVASHGQDIALYEWARERFQKTLAAAHISALELLAYRAVNHSYGAVRLQLGNALRALGYRRARPGASRGSARHAERHRGAR